MLNWRHIQPERRGLVPTWSELVEAARAAVIPAPGLRAATLAQWVLESGRGGSELARRHGNFAGLKWRPEMEGFATRISYGAHDGTDFYCAFPSASAFIDGYWRFLGRSVYDGWQAHADDPRGFLKFLKGRGYAGDPNYVEKVMQILPEAEALLRTAETAAFVETEEPDRPSRAARGEAPLDLLIAGDQPDFVVLPQVTHPFRGTRPNGLEGAIVHYDAGRTRPTKGPDDPEAGGRNTLAGGAKEGYAFATISRSGKIYLPNNMDWNKWGSHAGKSRCPKTKREGVSRYYVGFEVNSPGLVYPTADPQVYVPWFEAVRDSAERVVRDDKGRAKVAKPNGEVYKPSELRIVKQRLGNIAEGAYVPYTDRQFAALVAVMLWLKQTYPNSFRLDYVFGHDEVSLSGKVDPGGSLGEPDAQGPGDPMTMAGFRALLSRTWGDRQDLVA